VTAVQVQTVVGVVLIINTYDQIAHSDMISQILQVMRTRAQGRRDMANVAHTPWLGNFNRHHPLWEESCNTHLSTRTNLDKVQELIDAFTELGLCMVLPKDLLTLHALALGNFTRPNNVFASEVLPTAVVKCTTVPEEWPMRSNHLPIVITLDMAPDSRTEAPYFNYRATDWEDFKKVLVCRLGGLEVGEELHTEGEFSDQLNKLTQVVRDVVEEKVPRVKPSPYMK